MRNIYDEIGFVSKRNYREISKFTEPLKLSFGIDRFWRNFHQMDGSYSVLGNFPPLAEVFFGQNLYMGHPFFRHPSFFSTGYLLPELLNQKDYQETQGRLTDGGDCYHVMIYLVKHVHGVIEYGFASSQYRPGFEATYLNHLQSIMQFITAFEQNFQGFIHNANERRINIAEVIGSKYREKPQLPKTILAPDAEFQFLASIEPDPDKKRGLLTLTPSERVCLRHYLNGGTTKEIAKKLHRSSRTIEMHLENAKDKLCVNSRSQLFETLISYRELI
jgi:DNA-binding CsgD family transcriptional regulator